MGEFASKGVAGTSLSVVRASLSATTVGNYALFEGGLIKASTTTNTVDVIQ